MIEQSAVVCIGPEIEPISPRYVLPYLLWPNPTRYNLKIQLIAIPGEISHMEIVNVLGERIVVFPPESYYKKDDLFFKTEYLAPGMYILVIKTSAKTIRKPFIKE